MFVDVYVYCIRIAESIEWVSISKPQLFVLNDLWDREGDKNSMIIIRRHIYIIHLYTYIKLQDKWLLTSSVYNLQSFERRDW